MRILGSLAAALCLLSGGAQAATLTVSFTGTITSIVEVPGAPFSVGQAVSGSFQIDSAAIDTDPDPSFGLYPGAVSNFSFTFGGYTATAATGEARIGIQPPYDELGITGSPAAGPAIGAISPTFLAFGLTDWDATAFASDSLPTSLSLSSFEEADASIAFPDGFVTATLTSLSLSVPEPGVWALLAAASGWVGLRAPLRSQRARSRRC